MNFKQFLLNKEGKICPHNHPAAPPLKNTDYVSFRYQFQWC